MTANIQATSIGVVREIIANKVVPLVAQKIFSAIEDSIVRQDFSYIDPEDSTFQIDMMVNNVWANDATLAFITNAYLAAGWKRVNIQRLGRIKPDSMQITLQGTPK